MGRARVEGPQEQSLARLSGRLRLLDSGGCKFRADLCLLLGSRCLRSSELVRASEDMAMVSL